MLGFLAGAALSRVTIPTVNQLELIGLNAGRVSFGEIYITDQKEHAIDVDSVTIPSAKFVSDADSPHEVYLAGRVTTGLRDLRLADFIGCGFWCRLFRWEDCTPILLLLPLWFERPFDIRLCNGGAFENVRFMREGHQLCDGDNMGCWGFSPVEQVKFNLDVGPSGGNVHRGPLVLAKFNPRAISLVRRTGGAPRKARSEGSREKRASTNDQLRDKQVGSTFRLMSLYRVAVQTWFVCAWAALCSLLLGAGGFLVGIGRKSGSVLVLVGMLALILGATWGAG
jgi:hypothetical protein